MLLLEGHISNFTCVSYSFVYVEFSDLYVNQSLAGQTIVSNGQDQNLCIKNSKDN
jgi:hypothetical protein